jgi:hypothetical protein
MQSNNYILVRETERHLDNDMVSHSLVIIDSADLIGALIHSITVDAESNGFKLAGKSKDTTAQYRAYYTDDSMTDITYSVYELANLKRTQNPIVSFVGHRD